MNSPPTPVQTQCTHCGFFCGPQIRLHISVKITDHVPTDTQECINTLCHNVVVKTIPRVVSTTKNGLGKAWDPVWITYHDGVEKVNHISFQSEFP